MTDTADATTLRRTRNGGWLALILIVGLIIGYSYVTGRRHAQQLVKTTLPAVMHEPATVTFTVTHPRARHDIYVLLDPVSDREKHTLSADITLRPPSGAPLQRTLTITGTRLDTHRYAYTGNLELEYGPEERGVHTLEVRPTSAWVKQITILVYDAGR